MLEAIRWPQNNDAQRLFHGRGHAHPGYEHVNIDWYEPLVLITLYRSVDMTWLEQLANHIQQQLPQARQVVAQQRYLRDGPFIWLRGEALEKQTLQEQGIDYWLTLGKQQNTGIFLDMANGRRWLRECCAGKSVLNLFAYTCAFSVAAHAGGAKKIVNVDMSKASLSQGRENHRLNSQDLDRVIFEGVDIFKSFGRLKKHGPYDVIVCDPPTFQKGSVNIERDYQKIIRRIPQLANPGAELLMCLNAPDLDDEFLKAQMAEHCPDSQFVKRLDNPEVFVEAQPGKGLKALLFTYTPRT
ncbi:class I SAM-dependent methyltransferase [Bacterioplanoides sp. SCSIO 12839]|uniref:class I SAM-dependent methyltransferase n=1 Tax=Bacterioplanoides sp. SCSIO 12839 TaxID=2829569 RepID=UPI002105AC96|nr:class I SAM-dependent methyltransferase [Bacterioplanoides sp. SCSIO 12839]UTW49267.1 class I SAM-dependent methyltransferase [Bacterioplanoides sp. SCSIO 12839]